MNVTRKVGLGLGCALLLIAGMLGPARSAVNAPVEKGGLDDAPALTIYNQKFAVVRQKLALALRAGVNHKEFSDITGHLEPDSVILRPLATGRSLQVLEQNYRNDPITQQLLLSLYEGKTLDFQVMDGTGHPRIVKGKVIRSGFIPHSLMAYANYGQPYYQVQQAYIQSGGDQPIIEVGGQLQFTLPGQPIFPTLGEDSILKPTLTWELETDKPGPLDAEFSYVTEGMNWDASYNVVAPPKGNVLEMVGWVTLDNESGKTFPNARIKLMAGDVNKLQPIGGVYGGIANAELSMRAADAIAPPPVTERNFDEYHLYTLQHATTIRDREIKQVEFVRAAGIQSKTVYVYDGFRMDQNYRNWPMESLRSQENFGVLSNPKIWVMQEFQNSSSNHLGMPMPKGRVRFYRRDEDGQLEFTGENYIDHTPKDETVRLYTGNAFDMTGSRRRTEYRVDSGARWVDETFEIKVRNHKSTAVDVRIVEHLCRWTNWEIRKNSDQYNKLDSQTLEFNERIPADGEKTVTYQVHYSW